MRVTERGGVGGLHSFLINRKDSVVKFENRNLKSEESPKYEIRMTVQPEGRRFDFQISARVRMPDFGFRMWLAVLVLFAWMSWLATGTAAEPATDATVRPQTAAVTVRDALQLSAAAPA